MSPLRQMLLSAALLAVAAAGLASISESVRGLLARIGIDASPLALASVQPPAPQERRPRPARVVMAEVTEDRAATTLRTIGTARAARSVALQPRAAGVLTEIGFRPGDRVRAGQVLAALDREAEEIALARAELAREAAAEDVARLTALAGRNATAQVNLEAARRALRRAELDMREARLALERRLVRAPFDGVVGLSGVEVGDHLRPDTVIGMLDDRSRLRIELAVPERLAALVVPGQPVTAETVARPGASFRGSIAAIDSRVDPKSRVLRVEAEIANDDDLLRPGLSFTVTLRFPGERLPSLPDLAIQWRAEGAYVWAVRDDVARIVPVEIVERRDGRALVRGAIAPGERVVTEGVHRLRPGARVADAPDPGA
ncbi:MAG: efflux RND transporter periplasmic adaptor subunit [Alphaproteobacteria bacterium]|nr:MAG: efflux RND transporter periplasmic adaptor subunit [Alphaproteobacteria bacterium]